MSYNWIYETKYTIDSFLLMDRWIIRMIISETENCEKFRTNMSIALAKRPYVAWYCCQKAPEIKAIVDKLLQTAPDYISEEMLRNAEEFIIKVRETDIVYTDPETMNNNCDYIVNWTEDKLLELADFSNKVVLDVGSGTGRLSFTAAKFAKRVYASEPCDMLREYLRDRIKREGITNMVVLDGTVEQIPFEDSTFDIVTCAHVLGDNFESEVKELERVVKNGGLILDCMGEDNKRRDKPSEDLINRGFEAFHYKSVLGGDIYRYRKKIIK